MSRRQAAVNSAAPLLPTNLLPSVCHPPNAFLPACRDLQQAWLVDEHLHPACSLSCTADQFLPARHGPEPAAPAHLLSAQPRQVRAACWSRIKRLMKVQSLGVPLCGTGPAAQASEVHRPGGLHCPVEPSWHMPLLLLASQVRLPLQEHCQAPRGVTVRATCLHGAAAC